MVEKKITCITQLPLTIVLVLLINYDARAAKIKLSVIVCYFFFNERLSQINKKTPTHVSKENVYITM